MAKLNENLIRSILQDLKEIVNVCNEVHSRVGDVECVSWRYPTQNCDTVHINSILLNHTGSAGECYLLILELIYDRLHYLFNLLVKYLNIIPVLTDIFNTPRNVICPRQLTLGALLNMYWQRICALHQHLSHVMVDDIISSQHTDIKCRNTGEIYGKTLGAKSYEHDSHSQSTQTEEYSLLSCESCCVSEGLVKCLLDLIEAKCNKNSVPSEISKQKLHMKDNIFRVSQWSAMQYWIEAALKDNEALNDEFLKLKVNNRNLKREIKHHESNLEEIHQSHIHTISNLEDQLRNEMNYKLQTEQSRYADVLKSKNTLDLQITTLKTNFKALEEKLKMSEISQQQLINSNEQLKSQCMNMPEGTDSKQDIIEYKNKCEIWENKYHEENCIRKDLEIQLHEITEKLKLTESNFQLELQNKDIYVKEIGEKNIYLSNKIQELTRKSVSEKRELEIQSSLSGINAACTADHHTLLKAKISDLEEKLQESRTQARLLLEYPDFNAPLTHKVCGDPVQDMEGQFRANQIRIHLLEEQNQKLETTLNKLRMLSTKHLALENCGTP